MSGRQIAGQTDGRTKQWQYPSAPMADEGKKRDQFELIYKHSQNNQELFDLHVLKLGSTWYFIHMHCAWGLARAWLAHTHWPGPLFTKRTDVLPQVKSRSRDIRVQTFRIALKFDRHLGSTAVETPVKFQSDTVVLIPNLGLRVFTRFGSKTSYRLVNRGPGYFVPSAARVESPGACDINIHTEQYG